MKELALDLPQVFIEALE